MTTQSSTMLSRINKMELSRAVCVAALASVVILIEVSNPENHVLLAAITGAGLVFGCWPVIIESWHDIVSRKMSMDLSMLIAIAAAAAIGQWGTSLLITFFVLAAEILEDLCMDRGRDALGDLMDFLPHTVHVRSNATSHAIHEIPLSQLVLGAILVVSPGERIPADGIVCAGLSQVDQSQITGQPLPVAVNRGDSVFAGSINQEGALEVRVDKIGEDSTYGKIIQAVKESQSSSAPIQRLADKMATSLVILAVIGAFITWFVTKDLKSSIDVVIVAGACGIAAGTPLAMLASIARAAHSGSFVKDGSHMETLAKVDTVFFDKTGTLTSGIPSVTQIRPTKGIDEQKLLSLAASAELNSEHVLGKAIVAEAKRRNAGTVDPTSFAYQPGLGLNATVGGHRIQVGNRRLVLSPSATSLLPGGRNSEPTTKGSVVHVSSDGQYLGSLVLSDAIRPDATHCLQSLNKMGIRTVMLTGDDESSSKAVGQAVDIDEVKSNLLPEDKLNFITEQHSQGHIIAMIGDGVNDAPSLVKADVGIAMAGGTDIAQESSDIVLISSRLDDITTLLRIARRARSIVAFNFAGTIIVDLIGMLLAATGVLTPVAAAITHVGSESVFILNSARLIPTRSPKLRLMKTRGGDNPQ